MEPAESVVTGGTATGSTATAGTASEVALLTDPAGRPGVPGTDCAPSPATDPPEPGRSPVVSVATLAAVVIGMAAAALYRQGAFYPRDAFGLAVACLALVVVALLVRRDRASAAVALVVGCLAGWWLVRALMERSPDAFLPFGAAALGFLAAFVAVRGLGERDRARVAGAVVAIGTLSAAAGVVGGLGRWHPLAQRIDGVWVVSTTLTYPAASAVLFIVTLLVGLALDLGRWWPRLAVCLGLMALIGTQSRWELVALAVGGLLVPRDRWRLALWPLAMGALGGAVVVGSASGGRPEWWSWSAVAVVAAASTLAPGRMIVRWGAFRSGPGSRVARWLATAAFVVVAGFSVLVVVHPPVGRTVGPTAGQAQTLAWTAAGQAWRSSPITGTGPPRSHTTGGPVSTYPGLVPDGYLTILAEGGIIGLVLLVAVGATVVATFERRDLLSSAAVGAVAAFAVAGIVDYDWLLPGLALVGGCVAGLASGLPSGDRPVLPPGPSLPPGSPASPGPVPAVSSRHRRLVAPGLWVAAVVLLVVIQLLVGAARQAGGTTPTPTPPLPTRHPEAPARVILTGADPTDPFMIRVGGHDYLYTSEGITFLNVPLRIGSPGHWGRVREALPRLPAWAEGGITWAPDVHRVKGGWALYFTAVLKGVNPFTHCIGSAFASSPAGPFVPTDSPFICQLDHRGSIDARVFAQPGGGLVLLWKSEDNANPSVPGPDQNGLTGIYAQSLSPDGRTLLGQPVKILAPTEPWEGTIVEAPDMVEAWGTYWLFFSGNWYDSTSYGIGVAACQSPFGPCTDPDPLPFIGSNLQGAGPGEASLFRDGSSVFLLYNPFKANDPGPVIPRPVVMVRLGFTPKGPYLAAG
jgi:hypothetical protein